MNEPLPPISSSPQANPNLWPVQDPAIQAALDASHLRLLEIGFYISGILTALRFVWLLFMGVFLASMGFAASYAAAHHAHASGGSNDNPPPAIVFVFLAIFFGAIVVLSLVFAGLEIYAGICLKKRRHPILIQIIAGFYCISIPWGTALGVATFIVLNRPTVRAQFARP